MHKPTIVKLNHYQRTRKEFKNLGQDAPLKDSAGT